MAALALVAAQLSMAAPAERGAVAAFWAQHDEIQDLRKLDKHYTCSDMFYKYRDVLELLGARAGATIYAYGCSGTKGTSPRDAPRVELRYEVPSPYPASATLPPKLIKATLTTIELAPGHPSSLQPGDCSLVENMRAMLLPAIGAQLESSHLDCEAKGGAGPQYRLVVRAWKARAPAAGAATAVR